MNFFIMFVILFIAIVIINVIIAIVGMKSAMPQNESADI